MGLFQRLFEQHKPLWAEAFGTFCLVLVGTSAVTGLGVAGQATTAAALLVGTLAFSLTLGWLVYSFGPISGGHFNPAVTTMEALRGHMGLMRWLSYVGAQLGGAILASIIVALLYGTPGAEARLGAPYPTTVMGPLSALVAELLGTVILLLSVRKVVDRPEMSNIAKGSMVGLGLALGGLVAGAISGGSLNPARALGPELVAADIKYWWVYVFGPILAASVVAGWSRLQAGASSSASRQSEPANHDQVIPVQGLHTQQPTFNLNEDNAELQEVVQDAEAHVQPAPDVFDADEPALEPLPIQPTIASQPLTPSFVTLAEDEPTATPDQPASPSVQPTEPPAPQPEPARPTMGPIKFVNFERTDES